MGWVYIAANSSISDLVKIGSTDVSVASRISALSNTSVPERFVLVGSYEVTNAYMVEQIIHTELDAFRYDDKREFFRLTKEISIILVRCICEREELRLNPCNRDYPTTSEILIKNPSDLGSAFRMLRHREAITQVTAANMAHLLPKTLSAIENGASNTGIGNIYKLLKTYNMGLAIYSKGILPTRCALP